MKTNQIHSVNKINMLEDSDQLTQVEEIYKFKSTSYYNSLINWEDENDPIRNMIIPNIEELDEWGSLDASGEHQYQKMEGMEHKYSDTVLLLMTNTCEAYCRYCFRKRLFLEDNDETIQSVDKAINYIKEHKEVNNVLLTGGDPLSLGSERIMEVLDQLSAIDHLKFIRIGSKILSFNPFKVTARPELLAYFSQYPKPIYLMSHFSHEKEITTDAIDAIDALLETNNIVISNQTPILRGINETHTALKTLLEKLVEVKVVPYYFFQMRPVSGNKNFVVPIEQNITTLNNVLKELPGLMGRVKLVMSHVTGKIELVGTDSDHVYMKYHRAKSREDFGRILVYKRDAHAYWLDDYLS